MNLSSASKETRLDAQPSSEADTRLRGRWLIIARSVWVVLAALTLGLIIASIPSYSALLHVVCSSDLVTCRNNGQLTPADLRALQALGLSLDFYATYWVAVYIVFTVGFATIGTLIFWRKSDDRMALFASLTLILFPAGFNSSELATLPSALVLPGQILAFLGNSCLFLFFYLFPTGRFVPRWTRWLWVGVGVLWAVNIFFPSLTFNSSILFAVLILVLVGSALAAQIYRYRRVSNVVQQQQTKWVVYGISTALGSVLVLQLFLKFFPSLAQGTFVNLILGTAFYFSLFLIPLSIGVAILRSRLWDIDIIIYRTLVYGILTASIVVLYVLVVGGLSTLLQVRGSLIISLFATGLIAVLFQPLRARLQSAINRMMYGERDDPYRLISRLGEHLEATLVPDAILPTIVETVAQALRLPYVAIEVGEGEQLRLAASYGMPVDPALRIPLHYQQDTIGELLLAARSPGESFSSADRKLLDDLARQIGVAAHAVRLSADLQRSRERLVLAREEERRRLARELHDSVSQALYGIALGVHTARMQFDRDPKQLAESLDYVLELADAALVEMRALIFELRPESLEAEGLVTALTKQAAALQARQGIVVQTDLGEEPDIPLEIKQDLYRIVQEALHNTVKHARASLVELRMNQAHGLVTVEVRDNGKGFDTATSFPGHLGLHSMQERVKNLGGELRMESAPGQGTCIRVRVPGTLVI